MDKDPETLEEAIEQIKQWRELYCVKLQEIAEMNEELYRIRAEARAEALRVAEKQSREWFAYVSNDYDHDAPGWAHKLAAEQESERAALAEKGE